MGGVLPTESNINMTGAGLVGKSTSGAGKSGRMDSASVLSWLGLSASGVTDGKALIASSNSIAWSPAAAALLPDTLPAVGTLLSYGGSRQLAAGGTVSHSGALTLGGQLTCGAITASGQFTNSQGTLTSSAPLTLTQTWNNSGVTFTGLVTNITDTSSASYSLLMDLQSSGNSIFSVRRAYIGGTKYNRAVLGLTKYSYITGTTGGFVGFGTDESTINVAIDLGAGGGIRLASGSCVAHVNDSSNVPAGIVDLAYGRDSAGVLGIYTSTTKTTKGALTCGAITASGTLSVNAIQPASGSQITIATGTGYTLYWNNSGLYSLNQAQPLGNSSHPWGAVTCGAITASGTVLPASSGSQALGSTSAYWGTLHLTTLKSAGAINVNTNGTGYGAFAFGSNGYLDADQLTIRSNNQVSTRLVVSSSSITSTIPLAWTPQQSSLDPTTIDIPSGRRVSWYNSTLAEFRDWVNIGGTLLKSAAYT